MRYIKFIRVFLLVLIIIGLGLLATQKMWVPKIVDIILKTQDIESKNLPISNHPEVVVKNFYNEYIKELNNEDKSGNLNRITYVANEPFTVKLQKDLNTIYKDKNFDYDPLLCAQDFPLSSDSFVIKVVSKSASVATIRVNNTFDVELLYQDNQWKMNAVHCLK